MCFVIFWMCLRSRANDKEDEKWYLCCGDKTFLWLFFTMMMDKMTTIALTVLWISVVQHIRFTFSTKLIGNSA